jgi:hypothetical protein
MIPASSGHLLVRYDRFNYFMGEYAIHASHVALLIAVQGVFGGLGLVLRLSHLGDIVCIMYGSKMAVVLRRDGNERLRYRVVGQCYWEGVMYGG